jgi:predicted Zn-dependent protease with MMP-like domain
MHVDPEVFKRFVTDAVDNIPTKYADHIKNVAFIVEDEPDRYQVEKIKLRADQSLFGLYEGIPLTKRSGGYNLVLPDKITIFQWPIEQHCRTIEEIREQVTHTVWHEVAHYFGLDHDQIHELERK